jgi:hypothetical protein
LRSAAGGKDFHFRIAIYPRGQGMRRLRTG